ncbi:unnamed protein product [Dibothriocephalus latus]|uniref:Uncharacterized protein n=1 Tax=Dibothriocephalus latus TaxID=60516 RepID=A0A3P7LM69_DIBLA|nr:unnamed protein product [Dibothriocephalus latus]
MSSGVRHAFRRTFKDRLRPSNIVLRAANSTLAKASNVLNAAQKKLDKQTSASGLTREMITSDSERLTSSNNNTEDSSECSRPTDLLSNATTSTASSGFSSNLEYLANANLPSTGPLPKPVCRLGDLQIEWEGGDTGWQLIPLDSAIPEADLNAHRGPDDLDTLRRTNEHLRREQELLKTKMEILLNSIAEQTALVSIYEDKLEKLRAKVKQQGYAPKQIQSLEVLRSSQMPQPIPARDEWIKISQKTAYVRLKPGGDARVAKSSNANQGLMPNVGVVPGQEGLKRSHYRESSIHSRTETVSDPEETISLQTVTTPTTVTSSSSSTASSRRRGHKNGLNITSVTSDDQETESSATMTTTRTKTVQFAD